MSKQKRRVLLAGVAGLLVLAGGLANYFFQGPASFGQAASQQDGPNTYRIVDDPNAPSSEDAGKVESNRRDIPSPTVSPSPADIPNFVKVEAPEYESWAGPTCNPPRPGSLCRVLFRGGVHSEQEGTIHILIFENGRPTPAAEKVLPTKGGFTRIDHWVDWAISPDAEWTEFRTELRDSTGQVVAKSFAQRYPIKRT